MNNLNRWLLPITTFLFGVAVALFVAKKLYQNHLVGTEGWTKFNEVLAYVDKYYMDDVEESKLFENAIQGMLQSLDPHSVYSTAEENKQFQESLEGNFEGVGIQFNIMNDTVMVIAVISGGPSEKVGIRAGDRIVAVNGERIAGVNISSDKVFKTLRGKKGTKVKLAVVRPGSNERLTFDVIRDKISTSTLDVAYKLTDHIGYVKLNQFGENTFREFYAAVEVLKQQGMQSLILDLRGNSGGYLEQAIQICDAFLPAGQMIVYTEGKHSPTQKVMATKSGCFENGKLVVLIDEFSASASEIVAGAVQDNDRGTVIGRRSFGKGLVQQLFNLKDGSSIRLTVARYHTPSGRCIQRNYDAGTENYYEDLLTRYENGEMDSEDSIKMDKSLRYTTRKGRVVYGGGGIMPDVFVPIDRNENMADLNIVLNSGLAIEYAFNYVTQNKAKLSKQYPSVSDFIKKMTVTDAMVKDFLSFYKNKKSEITLNADSQKELKVWLKALIGRNLYGDDGFYPIINTTDKTILKAIETINQ